ncbi:phosphoenolpyruvate carboxykinase (ATP) [Deminuibacter soli]|uniref:Phosphoenolpyruvate carboxykinase (ATP) n=1 Tax=Deminuibacter soli TaxID=2291815 RepID=A0A3E1NE03_9BACT|nr:phosphoenolpyruvate carboxykinase (ATP) [Deminuibacter soli]RFM26071.1 phosphoenolpyruvate carboxykinase (ATP) [Deminuibacter soli]
MPVVSTLAAPKQLARLGLGSHVQVHYQLQPHQLIEQTLQLNQGVLSDTGALCINTGQFTGRSPQDKFMVKDALTECSINWNNFNIPIDEQHFIQLKRKMIHYLNQRREVWIRDCQACADERYRFNIRVINEHPWSNLFAHNMFIRPGEDALENFNPEWLVIHAPGFKATPLEDGTRQENFAVLSFSHKTILIGGTAYTGEIKKGIFTILNYLMPKEENVLSMHCSANMGEAGDVAVFFGLSGTGKTTLSTHPSRKLIGDDEHGWAADGIFNFEGGCYAKCINLQAEKEPDIFNAIRPGALVENTRFYNGTQRINFNDGTVTENTRVSYPLHFIPNSEPSAKGGIPKNIFFLTCDAYGVLPPVSQLTPAQAMYHFISGYTAKVAGTETGICEPKSTFSACFGAPFMPLHPVQYAEMLGQKLKQHKVNVWLINTGWTGGCYGSGERISLAHTRAMVDAALNGSLQQVPYEQHPVFGMMVPQQCPGVPACLLNPRNTWKNPEAYDAQAKELAGQFRQNFSKYMRQVPEEIFFASPLADSKI